MYICTCIYIHIYTYIYIYIYIFPMHLHHTLWDAHVNVYLGDPLAWSYIPLQLPFFLLRCDSTRTATESAMASKSWSQESIPHRHTFARGTWHTKTDQNARPNQHQISRTLVTHYSSRPANLTSLACGWHINKRIYIYMYTYLLKKQIDFYNVWYYIDIRSVYIIISYHIMSFQIISYYNIYTIHLHVSTKLQSTQFRQFRTSPSFSLRRSRMFQWGPNVVQMKRLLTHGPDQWISGHQKQRDMAIFTKLTMGGIIENLLVRFT